MPVQQPMLELPSSGLHADVHEPSYHADSRSLSSTSAKNLLYKGAAAYREESQAPREYKDVFDFGSVVHGLVLGAGDYEVLDFPDYRTKKAKAARDEVRARGAAPILPRDLAKAEAMRDAVFANSAAAALLSEGRPEISMWATDPDTGVVMRGRVDWLREITVDLKTTSGDVGDFMETVWSFHYGFQFAYYLKILALNGVFQGPPAWIVAGKREPYDCAVYTIDMAYLLRCMKDVDRALHLYAHCLETGEWPELEAGWQLPGVGAPGRYDYIPYVESVVHIAA